MASAFPKIVAQQESRGGFMAFSLRLSETSPRNTGSRLLSATLCPEEKLALS